MGVSEAKPPNVGSGDPLGIAVGKTTTGVPLLTVVPQPARKKLTQKKANPTAMRWKVLLWWSLMCIPSSFYPRNAAQFLALGHVYAYPSTLHLCCAVYQAAVRLASR